MKKAVRATPVVHLSVLLLSALLYTGGLNAQAPAAAPVPSTSGYQQQLAQLLTALTEVTAVPAFSVAVVHKGELVAAVATGQADIERQQAVTPEHVFRLASVSKVIGATMLAQLVLDNKLNPDQPIGRYYPQLDKKYHAITTRQLLAHTAGIPHYQARDFAIGNTHYSSALLAVNTLQSRALLSVPGQAYSYSSHGYTLAGALYEKITDQPLPLSVPQFVAALTGKSTPLVEDIHALHPMAVSLYQRDGWQMQKQPYGEMSYSVFGAGLSATASDLAYFGSAVLQQSRASDAFKQLLFTPVKLQNGSFAGTAQYQLGFGWRIGTTKAGRTVYHHAGTNPGARSVILLYPDDDLSITLLSNSSWVSSIEQTADALASLYLSGGTAKALNSATRYTLHYEGVVNSGQIHCRAQQCYLADDTSALATWLNRFNPTGQDISNWPLYRYSSEQGEQLILVSKIGFIQLSSAQSNGRYDGIVSGDKPLSITLH